METVRKRVPMHDPRPRNSNGTLATKLSRERYIKIYGNLGWMNVKVEDTIKPNTDDNN